MVGLHPLAVLAARIDAPVCLVANLAIGGNLSEENNSTGIAQNAVPAEFKIDWIRVYQCKDDRETGLACMRAPTG